MKLQCNICNKIIEKAAKNTSIYCPRPECGGLLIYFIDADSESARIGQNSPYPFPTEGFDMSETPDGCLAVCEITPDCSVHFQYGCMANPGGMATDLLRHRLEHRIKGFELALDVWNPDREKWADYEQRVIEDTLAQLEGHIQIEKHLEAIRIARSA